MDRLAADTIRVATLNIHHGATAGERPSIADQAAFIASLGADLVALQECDVRTERSGRRNQVADIAAMAGYQSAHFGQNLDYKGGGYGCALLGRIRLDEAGNTPLPMLADSGTRVHVDGKTHSPEPRGLLSAVALAGGQRVLFMTTHASIWPEERLLAAGEAIRRARGHAGPVVFAGDFNSESAADADIAALRAVFTDAAAALGATGPTFPSGSLAARIDYVFLRGARPVSARVVPTMSTDHAAVVVDIEIG